MPLILTNSCEEKGSCRNLKIIEVRVRAVWIMHGAIAAPLSIFTGSVTGHPVTHWWIEIETEDKNEWFCAQFDKPNLTLTKHSSLSEVTALAKRAAGRKASEDVKITNKYVCRPGGGITMGKVYDWMKQYDSDYNLVFNNCQGFGEAFISQFSPSSSRKLPDASSIKPQDLIIGGVLGPAIRGGCIIS